MKKDKIGILSLGCPRNLVDSEAILGRLDYKGYSIVDIDKADVAIINTCAFIKDAKAESIDAILDLVELKKNGKLKKIIACGCLVQRYKDVLRKELPEIDAFVGNPSLNHSKRRFGISPRYYAYLKICESCSNFCSFCIIPKIKGKFTSLGMDMVLEKVRAFDGERISELNIIGQDISGYGLDLYGKKKLPELLKKILNKSRNIPWFRLLYLYPDYKLVSELLEIMKDNPRVCKYIDLPLQHINNRILRLMNRHITAKEIAKIIGTIRNKMPKVAIRTSLIVGFPSETKKEFDELVGFVEDVRFERLGVFMYSPEEGTAAYNFKGQVNDKEKERRFDRIMLKQQEISRRLNRRLMGEVMEVIIEGKEKQVHCGRTQYDAPEVDGVVYINSDKTLKPGDFVKVKITDTLEYDLVGEILP